MDKANKVTTGVDIADKVVEGAKKAGDYAEQASNCTVMNVNKIEYDDPEIDAAIKEGDVEILKAALGSNKQENNLLEPHPERNANLEELLAVNNIERGALEEILKGLSQIDVPDFEAGHSSSYIVHQSTNTYAEENLEVSELGAQNIQEENSQ
jgi:hypothetical protein